MVSVAVFVASSNSSSILGSGRTNISSSSGSSSRRISKSICSGSSNGTSISKNSINTSQVVPVVVTVAIV
jgi:hypothetical protein